MRFAAGPPAHILGKLDFFPECVRRARRLVRVSLVRGRLGGTRRSSPGKVVQDRRSRRQAAAAHELAHEHPCKRLARPVAHLQGNLGDRGLNQTRSLGPSASQRHRQAKRAKPGRALEHPRKPVGCWPLLRPPRPPLADGFRVEGGRQRRSMTITLSCSARARCPEAARGRSELRNRWSAPDQAGSDLSGQPKIIPLSIIAHGQYGHCHREGHGSDGPGIPSSYGTIPSLRGFQVRAHPRCDVHRLGRSTTGLRGRRRLAPVARGILDPGPVAAAKRTNESLIRTGSLRPSTLPAERPGRRAVDPS